MSCSCRGLENYCPGCPGWQCNTVRVTNRLVYSPFLIFLFYHLYNQNELTILLCAVKLATFSTDLVVKDNWFHICRVMWSLSIFSNIIKKIFFGKLPNFKDLWKTSHFPANASLNFIFWSRWAQTSFCRHHLKQRNASLRAAQPSSKMSSWALCISACFLALMVFHQPRWKGNNNCILSASADETCLVYTRRCAAMKKGGQWKMLSVTLSVILLWLSSSWGSDTVISSNAGSWLKRHSSSGMRVPADGVARLPRHLNWHYINTLCQGAESSKQENNNSAKLIAVVKSHWVKGGLGE